MIGSHAMTREDYRFSGGAAGAIAAFNTGAEAWRDALISADEAALMSAVPRQTAVIQMFLSSRLSGGSIRNCCTMAPRSRCFASSSAHGAAEQVSA